MRQKRTHNIGLAIAGVCLSIEALCLNARHRQAPGRYASFILRKFKLWFNKIHMKHEVAFENRAGSEQGNKFFNLDNRMRQKRAHNIGLAIAGVSLSIEALCSNARHRQAPGR